MGNLVLSIAIIWIFFEEGQARAQRLGVRTCSVNLRQDSEIRKNGEISVFAAVGRLLEWENLCYFNKIC